MSKNSRIEFEIPSEFFELNPGLDKEEYLKTLVERFDDI